ncbi:MAG: hypothetical protein LUE92_04350, partial [Clostridiales bacterium]|nr:hypothetical protein [Clostridiales bacterium]
ELLHRRIYSATPDAMATATVYPQKVGRRTGKFLIEALVIAGKHEADSSFTKYFLGGIKFREKGKLRISDYGTGLARIYSSA